MYATGTKNYNLPQTVDSDKRTWDDVNEAYAAVDAALFEAYTVSQDNKQRLDILEPKVEKCEADIVELGGRMNDVENTVEQYTQVVEDCKTTVDTLTNQVTSNTSSITALQNTVAGHTTSINTLRSDVNTNKTNIATNTNNITSNTNKIASMRTDVDNNTAKINTATSDIEHIEGDVSNIQANNTLLANNITNVNSKVNYLNNIVCGYNESSTTASRAYVVNDFFVYNNTLYRVTQAISSGGTIRPGTNCTSTTITAVITSLLNA